MLGGCHEIEDYENSPKGVFEQLWGVLDEHYCFFKQKDVDWNEIHFRYGAMVSDRMTDEELFSVCSDMLDELAKVDGISFALGFDSFVGGAVPGDFFPKELTEKLKGDRYQLMLVASEYKVASDEVNAQINLLNDIVKKSYMALFEQISKDIVTAMKAKDKVALESLRNIKKFFLEAKTAPGANDELTDDAAMKILAKLAKQGKDTAALYVEQGRQDLAEEELAQVEIISRYLPKQLSAEELEQEIRAIIAALGATSPKDMGKVMGTATKQLAGKADGKAISSLVKQLLA